MCPAREADKSQPNRPIWLPTAMEPLIAKQSQLTAGTLNVELIGRRKPGVSLQQVQAEVEALRVKVDGLEKKVVDLERQLRKAGGPARDEPKPIIIGGPAAQT